MIKYIQNKQIRNITAVNLDFIREQYLSKLTSKNRLVGLIGQRGVGKTTLLLQYLKDTNRNGKSAIIFLQFPAGVQDWFAVSLRI